MHHFFERDVVTRSFFHLSPRPRRGGEGRSGRGQRERMVLGWPKRCKLAHASLPLVGIQNTDNFKRLKLARLLGQLGVLLAHGPGGPGG
jgi:hypothetical protein